MECLNDYIGLRGTCKDETAYIYIDDLPGINIVNIADVIDSLDIKPIDLVKRAFGTAIDQVYNDFVSKLETYEYNDVVADLEYFYAGNLEYYGEVAEKFKIAINLTSNYNKKYTNVCIYGLGFVSDRDVETATKIKVYDEYDVELTEISYKVVKGYNDIPINIETLRNKVTIELDLSEFKIGRKSSYNFNNCNPCLASGMYESIYLTPDRSDVGFDLKVKIVANRCEIVKYFLEALKIPLMYKTGINYFLEVKLTNRVNSYTRNSTDKIEEMLLMWNGGYTLTGQKISSAYWTALNVAAESIFTSLKRIKNNVFVFNGSKIINCLPG